MLKMACFLLMVVFFATQATAIPLPASKGSVQKLDARVTEVEETVIAVQANSTLTLLLVIAVIIWIFVVPFFRDNKKKPDPVKQE